MSNEENQRGCVAPPPIRAYSTWHQPDLVGQVCGSDGTILADEKRGETLIDLSGGEITWHPTQRVMLSWFRPEWRNAETCYPTEYRLIFSKPQQDDTAKWLNENLDVRFRIEDVMFAIQSWESADGETVYRATGRRVCA